MKLYYFFLVFIFSQSQISVYAQTTVIDSSFGINGVTITDIDSGIDKIYQILLQPDGKIIATGYAETSGTFDFALARFNSDGTLDNTFNGDGKLTTAFGNDKDKSYTMALQPDGKIIAAGSTWTNLNFDFAMARYLQNGNPDSTFGTNGKVIATPSQFTDACYAICLQPDGKILSAGYSGTLMAVMRFLTSGITDSTFGINGVVKTEVETNFNKAHAIQLQPDGKIIVAGNANNNHDSEFAIVRYLQNGLPDSSFGIAGIVRCDIDTADDIIYNLALQPDGKLIITGATQTALNTDFVVARYYPDGTPDSTFNNNGFNIFSFSNDDDEPYSVFIQPDGKIIVAGSSIENNNRRFAVARLSVDGIPDSTFGINGQLVNLIGTNDYCYSAIQQSDNKIVVAGFSNNGSNTDFTLFRIMEVSATTIHSSVDSNKSFKVFPNPAAYYFSLNISEWKNASANIELYDLSGRKIFQSDVSDFENEKTFTINLPASIASGFYCGLISSTQLEKHFRLIVIR